MQIKSGLTRWNLMNIKSLLNDNIYYNVAYHARQRIMCTSRRKSKDLLLLSPEMAGRIGERRASAVSDRSRKLLVPNTIIALPQGQSQNSSFKDDNQRSTSLYNSNYMEFVPQAKASGLGQVYARSDSNRDSKNSPTFDARDFQLVTCSISEVMEIASSRTNLVLFEIFGKINSPVVKHPTFDAVEFVLRDDTDAVSCIYYVRDAELRILRGGHYRCVGRVGRKEESTFNCLSIRPSSDTEKKFIKALITLS